VKIWGHEHAEARCLELSVPRTSEDGQFGNLSRAEFGGCMRGHARTDGEMKVSSGIYSRPNSGVSREDIHEPGEKQSQSCCPKKSGFRV
jgi:glucose-6-phosphate dehydrogenase assembly protein OpcA